MSTNITSTGEAGALVRNSAPVDPDHRTRTGKRHWSDEHRWRLGAKLLGISVDEYRRHVQAGLKWCSGCRCWQLRTAFGRHPRYVDGLNSVCMRFDRDRAREYQRQKRRPA